jgi:hypothetical protein
MSVKIDLLPGYVGLRRWFKRLSYGAAGLVALVAIVLFLFYRQSQQTLAVKQQDLEAIRPIAEQARTAQAAATQAEADAKPVETAVTFMVKAGKTGPERAALIDLVRRYIYGGSVVSSIDISDGQTVKINATVTDPQAYARFLLSLRQGSATNGGVLFAQDPRSNAVVANGIPGGPNETFVLPTASTEPIIVRYPLNISATGSLKNPIEIPTETGAAAATTTGPPGMPPGMSGMPPGMSGGPPPGVPTGPPPSGTPTP